MQVVPIEVLKWGTEFLFFIFLVIPNTIQFEKGMKLPPRFIVPFRIKEKIGPVSYCLVLPPHLHKTHDVFMYLSYNIMFLMNPTNSTGGNYSSQMWEP